MFKGCRKSQISSSVKYKHMGAITSPMTPIITDIEENEEELGSCIENCPHQHHSNQDIFSSPQTPTHKAPAAISTAAAFWLSAHSPLWCFSGCSTYVVWWWALYTLPTLKNMALLSAKKPAGAWKESRAKIHRILRSTGNACKGCSFIPKQPLCSWVLSFTESLWTNCSHTPSFCHLF